jgi:sulfur relay (sulfurtransferase) DsrC/TusE family protein
MKKLWIKKFSSFKAAEKADLAYYAQMSTKEKWDIMQFLRETYSHFKGRKYHGGTRLQRVLTITKRK